MSFFKIVLTAMLAGLLTACATEPKQSRQNRANDIHANSVMVTNLEANHGGSGTVLLSTNQNSYVLTNAHVCKVVENSGIVTGTRGRFMVTGYKSSKTFDLCLIRVSGNLGYRTTIADEPPKTYYETAHVSGFPALMPNVISSGHFSGKDQVPVMIGLKPCTPEEAQDPSKGPICELFGALPNIIVYESVLVSATIMPGSSGSGVYNKNLELAGVVFAGSKDFGYAWTVPFEDVRNFIFIEQGTLPYERPTNRVDPFGSSGSKITEKEFMEKLKTACNSSDKSKVESLCYLLKSDLVY